jgi:hypothetical protein
MAYKRNAFRLPRLPYFQRRLQCLLRRYHVSNGVAHVFNDVTDVSHVVADVSNVVVDVV